MINVTKAEFLDMIARTIQSAAPSMSMRTVRERADETFSKSFVLPNRRQGDRMLLAGYTVLLDRDITFSEFLSARTMMNVEMLLSRTALELYFTKLGMDLGWVEEKAIHNSHYIAHCLDPMSQEEQSVLF